MGQSRVARVIYMAEDRTGAATVGAARNLRRFGTEAGATTRILNDFGNKGSRALFTVGRFFTRQIAGLVRSFFYGIRLGAVAAGAAVADFAFVSIRAFADFDKKLRETTSLIAGGNISGYRAKGFGFAKSVRMAKDDAQQAYAQYSKAVLAMAPGLRKTPQDLIGGLYEITSAGITKPGKALSLLRVGAMGASVGNATTQEATRTMIQVMNALKIGGGAGAASKKQMMLTMDKLFQAVNLGVGIEFGPLSRIIGQSVGQVGVAMGKRKDSLDQMLGSIIVGSQHGLSYGQLGTGFANALQKLFKPSKSAEKFAASIGVGNLLGSEALSKYGFDNKNGVLWRLIEALKAHGYTQAKIGSALTKIFPDIRGIRLISVLSQHMGDTIGAIGSVAGSRGATGAGFAEQGKSFGAKLETFKSMFEVAKIQFGHGLMPLVGKAMQTITDFISSFNGGAAGASKLADFTFFENKRYQSYRDRHPKANFTQFDKTFGPSLIQDFGNQLKGQNKRAFFAAEKWNNMRASSQVEAMMGGIATGIKHWWEKPSTQQMVTNGIHTLIQKAFDAAGKALSMTPSVYNYGIKIMGEIEKGLWAGAKKIPGAIIKAFYGGGTPFGGKGQGKLGLLNTAAIGGLLYGGLGSRFRNPLMNRMARGTLMGGALMMGGAPLDLASSLAGLGMFNLRRPMKISDTRSYKYAGQLKTDAKFNVGNFFRRNLGFTESVHPNLAPEANQLLGIAAGYGGAAGSSVTNRLRRAVGGDVLKQVTMSAQVVYLNAKSLVSGAGGGVLPTATAAAADEAAAARVSTESMALGATTGARGRAFQTSGYGAIRQGEALPPLPDSLSAEQKRAVRMASLAPLGYGSNGLPFGVRPRPLPELAIAAHLAAHPPLEIPVIQDSTFDHSLASSLYKKGAWQNPLSASRSPLDILMGGGASTATETAAVAEKGGLMKMLGFGLGGASLIARKGASAGKGAVGLLKNIGRIGSKLGTVGKFLAKGGMGAIIGAGISLAIDHNIGRAVAVGVGTAIGTALDGVTFGMGSFAGGIAGNFVYDQFFGPKKPPSKATQKLMATDQFKASLNLIRSYARNRKYQGKNTNLGASLLAGAAATGSGMGGMAPHQLGGPLSGTLLAKYTMEMDRLKYGTNDIKTANTLANYAMSMVPNDPYSQALVSEILSNYTKNYNRIQLFKLYRKNDPKLFAPRFSRDAGGFSVTTRDGPPPRPVHPRTTRQPHPAGYTAPPKDKIPPPPALTGAPTKANVARYEAMLRRYDKKYGTHLAGTLPHHPTPIRGFHHHKIAGAGKGDLRSGPFVPQPKINVGTSAEGPLNPNFLRDAISHPDWDVSGQSAAFQRAVKAGRAGMLAAVPSTHMGIRLDYNGKNLPSKLTQKLIDAGMTAAYVQINHEADVAAKAAAAGGKDPGNPFQVTLPKLPFRRGGPGVTTLTGKHLEGPSSGRADPMGYSLFNQAFLGGKGPDMFDFSKGKPSVDKGARNLALFYDTSVKNYLHKGGKGAPVSYAAGVTQGTTENQAIIATSTKKMVMAFIQATVGGFDSAVSTITQGRGGAGGGGSPVNAGLTRGAPEDPSLGFRESGKTFALTAGKHISQSVFSTMMEGPFGGALKALSWLNKQVGKPYKMGGGHPPTLSGKAYDCSGLASSAMMAAGLHTAGTTFSLVGQLSPKGNPYIRLGFNKAKNPTHMGISVLGEWFEARNSATPILGPGKARSSWPMEGNPPKFHRGGVYKGPVAGGEGFALLRDEEMVVAPDGRGGLRGQKRQKGGGGITINIEQMVVRDDQDIQKIAERLNALLSQKMTNSAGHHG